MANFSGNRKKDAVVGIPDVNKKEGFVCQGCAAE